MQEFKDHRAHSKMIVFLVDSSRHGGNSISDPYKFQLEELCPRFLPFFIWKNVSLGFFFTFSCSVGRTTLSNSRELGIFLYTYIFILYAYISQPVHPTTQLVEFFPTSIMQWYLHKIFILFAWELQYVSITPHWFYICNMQPLYTSNFKNIMM